MSNDVDKVQIARGKLALHAGFWMALASKLEWIADDRFPTAGTNGFWVRYNRKWTDSLPQGEVTFIALHEIGHNMLAHMTRLNGRNPRLANVAMDFALNALLKKVSEENQQLGAVMPTKSQYPALYDPKYEGMMWEAIYDQLYKELKKQAGKGGGDGTPDTSGLPSFDEVQSPGSGTNEEGEADGSGHGMSEEELEAMRKGWTVATQAAATMAKRMGKLPGFMEEFIGELIKPKVDWRTQLRNCAARISKDESSYRRFNRRHAHSGTYLPGQYSERIGAIAYFGDTSGSISTDEFKAALGAMTDLLEDLKPERIYFGQCDTKLHSVQELTPDDLPLPPLKVVGRGGTDMREAFEWACAHEQEIDAFILQTDLYVPELDPSLIPSCLVIVIVTTVAPVPQGWEDFNIIRVEL